LDAFRASICFHTRVAIVSLILEMLLVEQSWEPAAQLPDATTDDYDMIRPTPSEAGTNISFRFQIETFQQLPL
jgi:hypothetical protein